ncbi:sulfite exporter TauE/SafE family protein [bacterium]|nr:sulfite exporter TauE/SafE family protein [bacterium]
MRRLTVLIAIGIFLFLGLLICHHLASGVLIAVAGVQVKQDVFIMFVFGLAALTALALYDVFAAFGSFRRHRDLQKQIQRLEAEKPVSPSRE